MSADAKDQECEQRVLKQYIHKIRELQDTIKQKDLALSVQEQYISEFSQQKDDENRLIESLKKEI